MHVHVHVHVHVGSVAQAVITMVTKGLDDASDALFPVLPGSAPD